MAAGDRIVKVTFQSGKFEYDYPEIRIVPGERLIWQNTHSTHHIAIHIGWDSPLLQTSYQAGPGESIEADVPFNAPQGDYKYLVAIFDGEKIWMDDPRFIIRP